VESRVLCLRHPRVILDADIAKLYGVPVKRLNEQVKRNHKRFPSDFMFPLTVKNTRLRRAPISAVCFHWTWMVLAGALSGLLFHAVR
jgi:hypothetical protein